MKKITIFAFIGFVFVTGVVLAPKAHAAEPVSGQEISSADAKILKQALDILGQVLKNVEVRAANNEFSAEKKVQIQASLATIKSSLTGVDYLVKNYAGTNYPGTGKLYVEGGEKSAISEEVVPTETQSSAKSGLASLWATIWPRKLIGMILLLAAIAVMFIGLKRKKQAVT